MRTDTLLSLLLATQLFALALEAAPLAPRGSGRRASGEAALVPLPRTLERLPGSFRLGPEVAVVCPDAEARGVAELLAERLRPATGLALPVTERSGDGRAIALALDPALRAALGEEGYRLEATPERVSLTAAAPAGLFYAAQTLCQLFPPAIDAPELVSGVVWEAPCARIEDRPRFSWRGVMLDCARHRFPVAFVKRVIDLAARLKLNRFHWHLTDDQGWRLAIRSHPELTEIGGRRAETPLARDGARGDGRPYGGWYTQDEVREVLAHARARFLTVVPEIELPGHATAALAAHPELSCTGGPFAVGTRWGVYEDVFCAGNDAVFALLQDVLDEVCALFPGPWVHVGGDEVPKTRWKDCPRCQERMRAEGLASEEELHGWFVGRAAALLAARGKRTIGWDEILEGALPPDATVMSWRGFEGGAAAARQGHDVVMCPTSHCYLDYRQSEDRAAEPPSFGGFLPLERVYAFEPLPEGLDEAATRRVLGTQGNLWSEYVPTPEHAEYMLFPRLVALAERAWSPADVRDFAGFRERLGAVLERLDAQGVGYRVP